MPWEHDRHWVRSYSGAGSQLLNSTTHMELHHTRGVLSTWEGRRKPGNFPEVARRALVCAGAVLCRGLEPASGLQSSSPFP